MKHKIFEFILAEGTTQVAMSNKKQSFGFTLAEVLITLGIIGVVAAITMPTLIQNYQKQVYVNQLKKTVSMLEQGFQKMLADEEVDKLSDLSYWPHNSWGWRGFRRNELMLFFNKVIAKNFNATFTSLDNYNPPTDSLGSDVDYIEDGYNNQILFADNSALVSLFARSSEYDPIAELTIDTNGAKGPNQGGRDIFVLYLNNNGKVTGSDSCTEARREYCFKHIMANGWKMDY